MARSSPTDRVEPAADRPRPSPAGRSARPRPDREAEAALIERCLEGEVDAFGLLVGPYQDRLHNTVLRLCGNADDAAELLQEALIAAYRGLASFQRQASFYTWVYRIAVNQVFSSRRRQKLPTVSADRVGANGMELADDRPRGGPDRRLIAEDRHRLIEAALAELAEDFRAVVVLKEIEDLKYEEIAEVLEIPVGTVRSRLHRARGELRRILQPHFDAGDL